jgi:hypothetical protein
MCTGEEAQALNRCHRIGQTHEVEVKVFYMQASVEERMLAFRAHESQFSGRAESLSLLGSGADSSEKNDSGNRLSTLSTEKCQFLLGFKGNVIEADPSAFSSSNSSSFSSIRGSCHLQELNRAEAFTRLEALAREEVAAAAAAEAAAAAGFWNCSVCTFLNENLGARNCEICNSPRPGAPSLSLSALEDFVPISSSSSSSSSSSISSSSLSVALRRQGFEPPPREVFSPVCFCVCVP